MPTEQHFHVARTLLEAGISVLVEKPMTPTLEEARELSDDDVVGVLSSEGKKRREAAEAFADAVTGALSTATATRIRGRRGEITLDFFAHGVTPQYWVDGIAAAFQSTWAALGISNDDFIRTTEPRHKQVVRDFLQKLFDKGEIYLAEYRGFYSTRQEQFLQEKDRNPDGTWTARLTDTGSVSPVSRSYTSTT